MPNIPFEVDSDAIFNAIISTDVSAIAKESGAPLVQAWLDECAAIDAEDVTVAVEAPFVLQADANTFIVGTMDRIARDDGGIFGCEWKTVAKGSPARGAFGGWNAEKWYESIAESHQLPTYAAALARGTFLGLPATSFAFVAPPVRILVRAVSKSVPPQVWPSARGAFVTVSAERIEATLNAYRVAAEQIRASRRLGLVPWGLVGHHCTKFNKFVCEHKNSCVTGSYPASRPQVIGSFSPGSQEAVKEIFSLYAENDKNDIDNSNDDLVILSASTLGDWAQCPEKFRRSSMSSGHEASDAQETGTVLHSALSELYSQQMRRG